MALARIALFTVLASLLAGTAHAMGDPGVAALQVSLQRKGLYAGTIDGIQGAATSGAVRELQRRARLAVDGRAGKATRRALGRFARHTLGSRPLSAGDRGWDVAALQFLLAWHGFPSGAIDGVFGDHVDAALRRFQRWAALPADGIAGRGTLEALQPPPIYSPLTMHRPLHRPIGDVFGPRGNRFHVGVDIPADLGLPVRAAHAGRVAFAGPSGAFGLLAVVAHGRGVRTFYAHLSRIGVHVGQRVSGGQRVGRVGSTGHSTGPHLHFEIRVRGAAVDPVPSLS